jgi:hypothetical protein
MWCRLLFAAFAAATAGAASAQSMELTEARDEPLACPGVTNTQTCSQVWEEKVLRQNPNLADRKTGHLNINLLNGEPRPVRRSWCDDCMVLVGFAAGERFAVIREQYYEGNTWHVLDRTNGKLTDISGYPLFSPNGGAFVAIQTDLDAQYSWTLIDVYDARGANPRRVFKGLTDAETRDPKWGPADVYWCDDTTIIFQRYTSEPYVKSDKQESLRLRSGRWRFERSPPDRCRSQVN